MNCLLLCAAGCIDFTVNFLHAGYTVHSELGTCPLSGSDSSSLSLSRNVPGSWVGGVSVAE
jgi:hypothetical protein